MDIVTYNKLQPLKQFVDFVANLKYATEENKFQADEIKYLIENISTPETFKNWNVCLNIFDRDIQYGYNKQGGIYHRRWWVFFEKDFMEIEAKTNHTDEPLDHYGEDFYYNLYLSFNKELDCERIYITAPVEEFVKDAMSYERYITEALKDIEINIEV